MMNQATALRLLTCNAASFDLLDLFPELAVIEVTERTNDVIVVVLGCAFPSHSHSNTLAGGTVKFLKIVLVSVVRVKSFLARLQPSPHIVRAKSVLPLAHNQVASARDKERDEYANTAPQNVPDDLYIIHTSRTRESPPEDHEGDDDLPNLPLLASSVLVPYKAPIAQYVPVHSIAVVRAPLTRRLADQERFLQPSI
eukprot:CAMPEP_0118654748 /NCGR_PEP_ID=MMETSP0785-20121206/12556_1 /TAXON_ID=91992 /ORGANISM="Bolidomonas pacifica, Strain CCMP 1866" /LENGTH=196 /DNA_ID=CAMNT_0006547431 /DNA_START=54 /DNA_END=643 /DNA_ORIENTATION=-